MTVEGHVMASFNGSCDHYLMRVVGASFVAVLAGEPCRFRRRAPHTPRHVEYLPTFRDFLAEQETFETVPAARAAAYERHNSTSVRLSVFMLYRGSWWHLRHKWTVPAFDRIRWHRDDRLDRPSLATV